MRHRLRAGCCLRRTCEYIPQLPFRAGWIHGRTLLKTDTVEFHVPILLSKESDYFRLQIAVKMGIVEQEYTEIQLFNKSTGYYDTF